MINILGVIIEERRPVLTGCLPTSDLTNGFPNCSFGGLHTQFEEFTFDALGAPTEIFLGHSLDQRDRFCG